MALAMSPATNPMGGPSSIGSPPYSINDRQTASREKRTFKDKLHSMIQDAEAAELEALREAQSMDKKSICISLLLDGRPQAFSDFFSLTHSSIRQSSQEVADQGDVPQEALLLIKEHLVRAESAARSGDTIKMYQAYLDLAKYFAQTWKLRRAEHFFKRCLQIAKAAQWVDGEMEANLALGVVYEELKDIPAAIACHEQRVHLSNAEENKARDQGASTGDLYGAYQSLTAVYMRQAQGQQSSGDLDGAIISYNKCIEATSISGDAIAAAKVHYYLGMIYHSQNKWLEAIHFLKKFLDSGQSIEEEKGAHGSATTTYAACQIELGDAEGASASLENYLASGASSATDLHGPAVACCSLGNLYFEQGKVQQAVMYFEKFFEMARALSDRRMVNIARTNLGVARGAMRHGKYMEVVMSDLPKLISWKNARVPFFDN